MKWENNPCIAHSQSYCKDHLSDKLKILDNCKILCMLIILIVTNGNTDTDILNFILGS